MSEGLYEGYCILVGAIVFVAFAVVLAVGQPGEAVGLLAISLFCFNASIDS